MFLYFFHIVNIILIFKKQDVESIISLEPIVIQQSVRWQTAFIDGSLQVILNFHNIGNIQYQHEHEYFYCYLVILITILF